MNIPDKYRDRYDRLAASHPWMREMRDEPELTVYNEASDDELFRCSYCHCKVYNIDMTEGDCGWGFTFCPQCGGEVYESDSRKIEAKLGEPTNGIGGETNGITDEITLPEGDAVAILRDSDDGSVRMKAFAYDPHSLSKLADMIERDYVSRETHSKAADIWQATCYEWEKRCGKLEAERDEWKVKCERQSDAIGEWELRCERLESECDEYEDIVDALTRQRDKWRAKAEAKSAKRAAAVERLKANKPHTYMSLVRDAVKDYEGMCDTDAFIDLLTDDDGATNLEWYYEHDSDFAWKVDNWAWDAGGFSPSQPLDEIPWTHPKMREWLMAPHEDGAIAEHQSGVPGITLVAGNVAEIAARMLDAQSDTNGTCPDSDETCPNDVDSREKLVNMPYHNGEKQAKLLGKEFDQVIFDELQDSREKLEAELHNILHCAQITIVAKAKNGPFDWYTVDGYIPMICELLDRQAAITANETSHDSPYVGLVRGKQWERTEISDYYCGRCGWKVTDHDSYCPECGGAFHKAPNKPDGKSVAPKTAETAETCAAKCDIRDFDDSREKLEADCTAAWKSVERIVRSGGMPKERWTNSEFFKLLDRQAAITERECRQSEYAEGDVYRKVYTKSHIDEMIRDAKIELELQRDRNAELQEALDQQRAATANANDLWGRTRDELAAVKAECEAYRNLFGKSLDLADEIKALGAGCDMGAA